MENNDVAVYGINCMMPSQVELKAQEEKVLRLVCEVHTGVSNGGTPNWMVYNGKSMNIDFFGGNPIVVSQHLET